MDIPQFVYIFEELYDDEVLRIEMVNGTKIYYLPSDTFIVGTTTIEIIKPIKKDKEQIIIIDANTISVICTMSRKTYDLKLQRGELYV